jgi:hypothetical protein
VYEGNNQEEREIKKKRERKRKEKRESVSLFGEQCHSIGRTLETDYSIHFQVRKGDSKLYMESLQW